MVVELPAASLKHLPRDDENVNWRDEPRALGDEDGEARNNRRILRILRLIVPRRKLRKESTPLDDGADDSRTAVATADGSSGDHCRRSRRSPPRSMVYNYSDCIPRWEETLGRPTKKRRLDDDFQLAVDADGDGIHRRRMEGRNSCSRILSCEKHTRTIVQVNF